MSIEQCFQPRLCCCRGDHWPLAVAWWRVNKQSWPRQISRTELWTVPRSQLFTQTRPEARPQQPAEMNWKCHLMSCIPETSVWLCKAEQYNPVCGATRRNTMRCISRVQVERNICAPSSRPRPRPGLIGVAGTRVGTPGYWVSWLGECLRVSVSTVSTHNKTITSIRGEGRSRYPDIYTHTVSSTINNGALLIDNT